MTLTACTIADRRFLPGLAALVNSLRASQFTGPIVVGTQDSLPEVAALSGVEVVRLDDEPLWCGFLKAALLLRTRAERFVFFDSDIVVGDPSFLEQISTLTNEGLVLALEGLVAPTDHRRARWRTRLGTAASRADDWAYYNGGFLAGQFARDEPFLRRWHEDMLRQLSGVPGYLKDREFPFGDQDVLNAIIGSAGGPIVSLQFPDWWSAVAPVNPFLHAGGLSQTGFYHSTGPKPWDLRTVPPRQPNVYEKLWFRFAVTDPTPLHVPVDLVQDVRRWLEGAWSGRLRSRGNRLAERLRQI